MADRNNDQPPLKTEANFFLYYFTALSCIGGFLFGYDTGVISGALVLIADEFNLDSTQQELVVSMTVAGALVSALFAGMFGDKFGRKPIVMISSIMFTAGSVLLSLIADSYPILLLGRTIVGLGVGASSMILPTYICEVSPADIRGTMVTYFNVSVTFGQFASSCIDGAFSGMSADAGWRWMLGLAAIPAFIQFLCFISLPESPRWLLEMDRYDEAFRALLLLRSPGFAFFFGNASGSGECVSFLADSSETLHDTGFGGGQNTVTMDAPKGDGSAYQDQDVCQGGTQVEQIAKQEPFVTAVRNELSAILAAIRDERGGRANRGGAVVGTPVPVEDSSRAPLLGEDAGDDCADDASSSFNANSAFAADKKAVYGTEGSKEAERKRAGLSGGLSVMETTTLRALILGCILQAAQQFAGINTIMYYATTILKVAGFDSNTEAILLTICVSFFNFAGSCIGLYMVDRIGRRRLTLRSLGAVVISLAAISVAFYLAIKNSSVSTINIGGNCGSHSHCFDCVSSTDCGFCTDIVSLSTGAYVGSGCVSADNYNKTTSTIDDDGVSYTCASSSALLDSCPGEGAYGWMIFVCLCIYLFAFAPGMGTMPWCVNSEIFPTPVRGTANSITTATNWTCNLIVSLTFLTLIDTITSAGAFALYAGLALLFLGFFYFYLPETKDVPLESVGRLFCDGVWGRAWTTESKRA